jgi:hypothetical protein
MLTLLGVYPIACTQTAFSQVPQQKQILTCDHPGYPSCYSLGYAAGLLNRGTFSSCSNLLLNSLRSATYTIYYTYYYTIVVDNYCSGFSAAQQQQQQHK